MVDGNLTKDRISAGAKLVEKLDERGMAPDVALWLYSADQGTWKLILVEVKLLKAGPKAAYAQLQNVLLKAELPDLSLDDLVLEKPNARLIELIRKAIRTGPGVSGIRFRNNVINGTLIEDAYIYRVV